jgi:hypothetical protein
MSIKVQPTKTSIKKRPYGLSDWRPYAMKHGLERPTASLQLPVPLQQSTHQLTLLAFTALTRVVPPSTGRSVGTGTARAGPGPGPGLPSRPTVGPPSRCKPGPAGGPGAGAAPRGPSGWPPSSGVPGASDEGRPPLPAARRGECRARATRTPELRRTRRPSAARTVHYSVWHSARATGDPGEP